LKHKFPGNIRELRNLVEYAVIFEQDNIVGTENIRKKIGSVIESENVKLADLTRAYEKTVIENKIKKLGDDLDAKKEAARQLGISIATLYRKLEV